MGAMPDELLLTAAEDTQLADGAGRRHPGSVLMQVPRRALERPFLAQVEFAGSPALYDLPCAAL